MTDADGNLDDNDRLLAAEYALGVLDADDTERARLRAGHDVAFRAEVEAWANLLAPMLDGIAEEPAPAHVWAAIEREIGLAAPQPSPRTTPAATQSGVWSSVAFWRWMSLTMGTLAAACIAALLLLPGSGLLVVPDQGTPLVATLSADGATPAFIASVDPQTGKLLIRAALTENEQRVPELWIIPDDGKPRSLGVIKSNDMSSVAIPAVLRGAFKQGGTLAISLEPAGGSPTGQPTGPVIASGKLVAL